MLSFLLTITDESEHTKIEYLFNMYHGDMIRFAKSRLQRAGVSNYLIDAEDAVQNAFIKITKYIKVINFDVTAKEIKAYIFSILSNEIINILNDNKYFEDIEKYVDCISDENFFERLRIREKFQEIETALRKLDEKYSITFLYYYYNEMSIKEIAELMKLPEKTIYTRLERGKKKLLDILQKEEQCV